MKAEQPQNDTPINLPANWSPDYVPRFPAAMLALLRWMVRRVINGTDNKQPCSPLAKKPAGYIPKKEDEGKSAWRLRWNQLCVCAGYQTAVDYWKKHADEVEGLSFILHPGGDDSEQPRIICIDFDHAFGPDGQPWPWIQNILTLASLLGCYVEFSRSGMGCIRRQKANGVFTQTVAIKAGR